MHWAGLGRGQGIVEYGLILGLSAVVAVVVLVFFGGPLADVLQIIGRAIDEATKEVPPVPSG
jgi:Flp pilus assembly pilin Flp